MELIMDGTFHGATLIVCMFPCLESCSFHGSVRGTIQDLSPSMDCSTLISPFNRHGVNLDGCGIYWNIISTRLDWIGGGGWTMTQGARTNNEYESEERSFI